MKRKNVAIGLLFCCVMLLCIVFPINAYAGESGLCDHHRKHDSECGYAEGREGSACRHEHTDECYEEVTECIHEHTKACYPANDGGQETDGESEPSECSHKCSKESGCITERLSCRHEHDSECGYVPAVEGTPCGYVCEICGGMSDEDGIDTDADESDTDESADTDKSDDKEGDTGESAGRESDTDESADGDVDIDTAVMAVSMEAEEVEAITLTASQETCDLTLQTGKGVSAEYDGDTAVWTLKGNGSVTVSGSTKAETLVIESGTVEITLKNATIDVSDINNACAFEIQEGAEVKLTLQGDNTLESGYGHSGLRVHDNAKLTITEESTGTLKAVGGDAGAGIGSTGITGTLSNGGTIIINGGTVTAEGGASGAGIGGGLQDDGMTIIINGGAITAKGGDTGAGIGGGSYGGSGSITVNGGTVTAVGGTNAAGIGNGYFAVEKSIVISGGYLDVTNGKGASYIGVGAAGKLVDITITGGQFKMGDADKNTVYNVKAADGYEVTDMGNGVSYRYKVGAIGADKGNNGSAEDMDESEGTDGSAEDTDEQGETGGPAEDMDESEETDGSAEGADESGTDNSSVKKHHGGSHKRSSGSASSSGAGVTADAEWSGATQGYRNIALFIVDSLHTAMGTDGENDMIIIVSVDQNTGDIRMLPVFCDTGYAGAASAQEDTVYVQSGADQALTVLNQESGLDITDYIIIEFDGLTKVIDMLGGIEINVEEEEISYLNNALINMAGAWEDGIASAETESRENMLLTQSGLQTLDGLQAAAYCRMAADGNDLWRAQRQQKVITAILNRAKLSGTSALPGVIDGMMAYVDTSIDANRLWNVLQNIGNYNIADDDAASVTQPLLTLQQRLSSV